MIRLIASDIDGTLLPAGTVTPTDTLKATLRKYLDRGTIIALTSGRPLSALVNLFPEYTNQLIYICANGSKIVVNGEIISISPLATEAELKKIMAVVRALNCNYMVDTVGATLVEEQVSEEFIEALKRAGIKFKVVPDICAYADEVLKISIASEVGGPFELVKNTSVWQLAEQYTLIPTGGVFLDIMAKNADKGTAVKIIQRKYDIRPEETIVFGDAMNDITMFDVTPNSYAVDTAIPEVKRHAKHTILPPEDDGVARCLEEKLMDKEG